MLPREHRLVNNRDFQKVYRKGKRLSGRLAAVNFLSTRMSISRFGIIVGKKYSKKAVDRNKAKRIFREALKPLVSEIKPGFDIIINIKPGGATFKLEEARKDLADMFRRGGLTK